MRHEHRPLLLPLPKSPTTEPTSFLSEVTARHAAESRFALVRAGNRLSSHAPFGDFAAADYAKQRHHWLTPSMAPRGFMLVIGCGMLKFTFGLASGIAICRATAVKTGIVLA